jgi:hypothetical protein
MAFVMTRGWRILLSAGIVLVAAASIHAQSVSGPLREWMLAEPPGSQVPPADCGDYPPEGTTDFVRQQQQLCFCGGTDAARVDALGRRRCDAYSSIGALWCSGILEVDGQCAFEVTSPRPKAPIQLSEP